MIFHAKLTREGNRYISILRLGDRWNLWTGPGYKIYIRRILFFGFFNLNSVQGYRKISMADSISGENFARQRGNPMPCEGRMRGGGWDRWKRVVEKSEGKRETNRESKIKKKSDTNKTNEFADAGYSIFIRSLSFYSSFFIFFSFSCFVMIFYLFIHFFYSNVALHFLLCIISHLPTTITLKTF